jgi:predicted anti-sigma-YlaC factor YlaD
MNEHDRIRQLMTRAEGEAEEIRQVREHLEHCPQCRRVDEEFAFLRSTLRGLPTPQPSAELLARVRVMAAAGLAQNRARDPEAFVSALLVVAAWIVALTIWPLIRDWGAWMLSHWRWPSGSYAAAFAAYSILGLLLSSIAAIAVGRRAGAMGRMQ